MKIASNPMVRIRSKATCPFDATSTSKPDSRNFCRSCRRAIGSSSINRIRLRFGSMASGESGGVSFCMISFRLEKHDGAAPGFPRHKFELGIVETKFGQTHVGGFGGAKGSQHNLADLPQIGIR